MDILSKTEKDRKYEILIQFLETFGKRAKQSEVDKDTFSLTHYPIATDLVECLLHETDTAAVDWLTVGKEALLQRRGHRGETLQQREQVLVIVLEMKQK